MFERWRRSRRDDAEPQVTGFVDLRLIGSGGFSKVYTAHQERLARTVALKVLTTELTPDGLRRFEREQQATGLLDGHPHVIRVYESGTTADGRPYMAMEYLSQGSLADRVRRHGPMSAAEALDVGVKLASALDAAHRRGIVHRDVKPQNVLVSPFVGPVLTDFGIAALDPTRMTVTVEAFTVVHAAPEVLDGEPATPASDLYSLGSTLYELVAGHAPFAEGDRNDLLALMRRVREAPVPAIDRPDVPAVVDQGLRALLARDPADRPADARRLAEALQQLQLAIGQPPTSVVTVPGDGREADAAAAAQAATWGPPPTPDAGTASATLTPPEVDAARSTVAGAGEPSGASAGPAETTAERPPPARSPFAPPGPGDAGSTAASTDPSTTADRPPPSPFAPPGLGDAASTTADRPPPAPSPTGSAHPPAPTSAGDEPPARRPILPLVQPAPPAPPPPGPPPPGPPPPSGHPSPGPSLPPAGEGGSSTVMRGRPEPAAPPPPPADEQRSRRRLAALLATGVLVVGSVLAVVLWPDGDDPEPVPSTASTTTTEPLGALPACLPSPDVRPDVRPGGGDAPTGIEITQSDDGTAATITWTDPNGGRAAYNVMVACTNRDRPDGAQHALVGQVGPGEQPRFTVEDLPVEENYCFGVGVWRADEDGTVLGTVDDEHSFLCLDGTSR